jgi:hypothetical protein
MYSSYFVVRACVGSWGYRGAAYGRATGWIPMDDVRCTGNEERLIDCRHRNSTVRRDCAHNKDASVVCQPSNSLLLTLNNIISIHKL